MPFQEALDAKIADLTLLFEKYAQNGLKIREIFSFIAACIVVLAQLAKGYEDVPRRRKKDAIVGAIRQVYLAKNPDLPWIMEPFESFLENMLLDYIVPQLYDVLVSSKDADEYLKDLLATA